MPTEKAAKHPCKGCGKMITLTKYMCCVCKNAKAPRHWRKGDKNHNRINKEMTQALRAMGVVDEFNRGEL